MPATLARLPMSARRPRKATAPDAAPETDVAPPGLGLVLLEARAPWEALAMAAVSPWLSRMPRGDGHAVLVFPGLGASDITTLALRRFLKRQGYQAYGWRQGLNLGPREGVIEACRERIAQLHAEHGGKLSLVGWSLGGIYAREMAKEMPERVRSVITLGTPFTGHPKATNAWRFYQWVSGQQAHDEDLLAEVRKPPPVPTTSIYSKSDGIVAWRCSLNPARHAHTENIQLHSSHIGMGMNPMALYAIADRLRQDPAHWKRFDAQGARRWFYKVAHQPETLTQWY